MATFSYSGYSADGKALKAKAEAQDPQDLYRKLKKKGIYVTDWKEHTETRASVRLSSKELSEFCRQLGTMLSAGINLTRSLTIIAQRTEKKSRKVLFEDINQMVQEGVLLSDAMERKEGAFPDLMINMIRAGETGGSLADVTIRLSDHYEKDNKLKLKVQSAFIYPGIVMVLTAGVVILIFTVILPQFYTLFDEMENLPITTRLLMGFSKFMTRYPIPVIAGVAVLIFLGVVLYRTTVVKRALDYVKLSIPVMNKLMMTVYTARFARGLSSLYSSGLSMIQSLRICGGLVDNYKVQKQFPDMIEDVKNGVALSTAISKIKDFDLKLASSIYVGEESGQIDTILAKMADNYDYEAEQATGRLVTFIEPLMIIFMAGVVGTIMVSVILPVYQYYKTLGG